VLLCRHSIQQLSACVDSVNEINRLVRLQLECESRTASVPAADLRRRLEVTVSSQQQHRNMTPGEHRDTEYTIGDHDNEVCGHSDDRSDDDMEDNNRWWASDYDDDDMVFQLSDIDDDNEHRGIGNWADVTMEAGDTLAWNCSFTQRLGDAVPPSFDDDSGNGYSCDSGSPCRPPDSQLLTNVPSLPDV